MCSENIGEIFRANEKDTKRIYYEESSSDFRGDFDKDRDRILYSKAFRRLSGKTQVFLSGKDDHIRNRLSHTLEVSQIARTISKSLGLNESLTEAIAFGHDIGHTPFGHIGERTLNYIMSGCDKLRDFTNCLENSKGFKHNWQSIRVVTKLENKSKNYKGLNLTKYTLWGILNHSSLDNKKCEAYYKDKEEDICTLRGKNIKCCNKSKVLQLDFYENYKKEILENESVTIEGLIVSIADEIAQRHHDVEDALEIGIISFEELIEKIRNSYCDFSKNSKNKIEKITNEHNKDLQEIKLSSFIVDTLTETVIENLKYKLESYKYLYNIYSSEDFNNKKQNNDFINRLKEDINFNEEMKKKDKEFQKFIWNRILHSHKAQCMDGKGNFIIRELFKAYLTNPQQLPDKTIIKLFDNLNCNEKKYIDENIGSLRDELQKKHNSNDKKFKGILMRTICDYIAGMTDNYALNIYSNLYENK